MRTLGTFTVSGTSFVSNSAGGVGGAVTAGNTAKPGTFIVSSATPTAVFTGNSAQNLSAGSAAFFYRSTGSVGPGENGSPTGLLNAGQTINCDQTNCG